LLVRLQRLKAFAFLHRLKFGNPGPEHVEYLLDIRCFQRLEVGVMFGGKTDPADFTLQRHRR